MTQDFREIAVRICSGCFDGNIDLNHLMDPTTGLDMFIEQAPVMRNHVCSGKVNSLFKNTWKEVVLKLPEELLERIKSDPAFKAGAPTTHPDWRTRYA